MMSTLNEETRIMLEEMPVRDLDRLIRRGVFPPIIIEDGRIVGVDAIVDKAKGLAF